MCAVRGRSTGPARAPVCRPASAPVRPASRPQLRARALPGSGAVGGSHVTDGRPGGAGRRAPGNGRAPGGIGEARWPAGGFRAAADTPAGRSGPAAANGATGPGHGAAAAKTANTAPRPGHGAAAAKTAGAGSPAGQPDELASEPLADRVARIVTAGWRGSAGESAIL